MMVQVKKRYTAMECFEQNCTSSRQILISVSGLVNKLRYEEGELYYLSAQQPSTTESDTKAAAPPFQVPFAQLLKAKKIEQTCAWMGW
jgi:hypothetical protein